MKIQHVKLSYSQHVLVIDGVRGPLADSGPAYHPAGFIAFLPDSYGFAKELQGKVFRLVTDDVEYIEDTACEPGRAAYKEYVEITRTCTEVKLARYGEEAPKEGS